jgi:hypothetical protein
MTQVTHKTLRNEFKLLQGLDMHKVTKWGLDPAQSSENASFLVSFFWLINPVFSLLQATMQRFIV